MSSSPVPPRRDRPNAIVTPARSKLALGKPKPSTSQFQSPPDPEEDVWDNDFDSAITSSALQLPHMRPQDHYGGLLSAEKLKAYATFETVAEDSNWLDNFEGDLTVKSPLLVTATDPLKTVRPYFPERANTEEIKTTAPSKSPKRRTTHINNRQGAARHKFAQKPKNDPQHHPAPTLQYREEPDEDYSDLVSANDGAFDGKLALGKVRSTIFLLTV